MPYTEEPRGLAIINNLNMATFGSLVTQALWVLVVWRLTEAAFALLLRQDGPALIGTLPVSHDAHRQLGFLLAGSILGALITKTGAGVYDSKLKREANPDFAPVLEAKERGKAAGAGLALAAKEAEKDAAAARQNGAA